MDEHEGTNSQSRFYHLLRPYRELADDWNIELAEDLIEYLKTELEDYEQASGINFAQAALLVQNSALVYTKKVESLYDLILKALEKLSSNPVKRQDARPQRTVEREVGEEDDFDDSVEEYEDTDEFDVIPVADHGELEKIPEAAIIPVCLAPLIQFDFRGHTRNTVNMSKTTVVDFSTGAFLLDSDATGSSVQKEIDMIVEPNPQQANPTTSEPNENADYDDGGGFDTGDDYNDDRPEDSNNIAQAGTKPRRAQPSWDDYIDANIPCRKRKDKPFKKGRCYVVPSDEKINKLDLLGKNSDEEDEVEIEPKSLMNYLVDSSTKAIKGIALAKLAFPEFLSWKKLRDKELRRQGRTVMTEDAVAAEQIEESEHDHDYDAGDFGGGDDEWMDGHGLPPTDAPALEAPLTLNESNAADQGLDTYADVVRSHVAKFMENARNWASESKLSLRVRGWHEYLEPILQEQETRPSFDLREYESTLVDELKQLNLSKIPFEAVVEKSTSKLKYEENQSTKSISRWEVCRLFLTSLELANQGTVEIDDSWTKACDTEAEFESRTNEQFSLTYLRPVKHAFATKGRKKIARLSVEDSENVKPSPIRT